MTCIAIKTVFVLHVIALTWYSLSNNGIGTEEGGRDHVIQC